MPYRIQPNVLHNPLVLRLFLCYSRRRATRQDIVAWWQCYTHG